MEKHLLQKEDIDKLTLPKSELNLNADTYSELDFNGYVLTTIFDDLILIEYVDSVDGELNRNGILLPGNIARHTWRKGKVILTGQSVELCKVGDIVVFPNDKGIIVKNLEVKNHGKLNEGAFLNERRIFGICEKL